MWLARYRADVPAVGGERRVFEELWELQEHGNEAEGSEGEEEENEEAKAIPASGVHRAKGADGREACTDGMHRKRAEILSIHGSRRVQPMDVSGDV